MRTVCAILVLSVFLLTAANAGAQTESSAPTGLPSGLAELVKQQFGPCFELATHGSEVKVKYLHPQAEEVPWNPLVTGDLDGDGVEDAVIIARCKDPLADQAEFGYRVIDPYYSAHGYGDPKVTSQFGSVDPTANNLLLVIHGTGPEGWRSAKPKAKFVVINLPFHTLSLGRVQRRKITAPAIKLVESESLSSVLFWDGKKYKWAEVGGN